MKLIDADALERDGWQMSRTVQIDKNTMEFQTRKPTDFPPIIEFDGKELSSSQPEKQHGRIFREIVIKYPLYSTCPEYKGKPYFSIKYTENGREFTGYGIYTPEVLLEFLKEYFMPSKQLERREKMEMTFTIEDADLDKLNNVLKDINVRECPWFEVHDKHGNKAKYYREPHWIPVTERLPDEDGYSMYDFDEHKSACSDCQEFDCYGCEHKEESK